LRHRPSGLTIKPDDIAWSKHEFNMENNHSLLNAKLRNLTLENTTTIYHLFQLHGRDLPKVKGEGKFPALALKDTAGSPPQPSSLKALKDSQQSAEPVGTLPALLDKNSSPAKGSPGQGSNSPAADVKQISSDNRACVRGADGVYRLTAAEPSPTHKNTSEVTLPIQEIPASGSATTVSAKPRLNFRLLQQLAEAAADHENEVEPRSLPNSPTDVVTSEEEKAAEPPKEVATDEESCVSVPPKKSRQKRIFLSPSQKNLRRLRRRFSE